MMNERELTEIWTSYTKLAEKIGRGDGTSRMLDELGERILMCPAEPRNDCPGCGPGGLVQQAILISKGMKKINDSLSLNVPTESILVAGLFHEVGKIGTIDTPYFLPEEEGWKRDKLGSFYKINDMISKTSVSERSLYLLQHYGVRLDEHEFMAIRGPNRTAEWADSRLFPSQDPMLSVLLKSSRDIFVRRHGS